MVEQVNHPDHYNIPGKRECIEAMKEDYGELITTIFCLTNAYKYLYRAGNKKGNSKEQDISKAKWYYDYQDKFDVDYVNNDLFKSKDYLLKLKNYVKEGLKYYGC